MRCLADKAFWMNAVSSVEDGAPLFDDLPRRQTVMHHSSGEQASPEWRCSLLYQEKNSWEKDRRAYISEKASVVNRKLYL